MKYALIGTILLVIVVGVTFWYWSSTADGLLEGEQPRTQTADYKNATFSVEGKSVTFGNAAAATSSVRFFGNEVIADVTSDGRDDVVFLVTDSPGGSGTFFYVVAAIATEAGYTGSVGYYLGDRIAPQHIEVTTEGSILVNYADRHPDEPMATTPSFGQTARLKFDANTLQFVATTAPVLPPVPEESSRQFLTSKTWTWESTLLPDGTEVLPAKPDVFSLTFSPDGTFSAMTDCNNVGGNYQAAAGELAFSDMMSTLMYCEDSQESDFVGYLTNTSGYQQAPDGGLILDLKSDSGTVRFR